MEHLQQQRDCASCLIFPRTEKIRSTSYQSALLNMCRRPQNLAWIGHTKKTPPECTLDNGSVKVRICTGSFVSSQRFSSRRAYLPPLMSLLTLRCISDRIHQRWIFACSRQSSCTESFQKPASPPSLGHGYRQSTTCILQYKRQLLSWLPAWDSRRTKKTNKYA